MSDPEDEPDDIARALAMALSDASSRKLLRPVEDIAPTQLAPSRTAVAWALYGVGVLALRLDWGSIYQAAMRRSSDAQGDAHGPWKNPVRLVEVEQGGF